ncbi:MAG: Phosphoribosyltransferase [Solirubrobacteraceae bacterium]|nr:Phosphoribosyltransferase [Solirubrobacteraceae bacterium]
MGAGALPVGEHRRRPPIPIVPVDAGASAAALARGVGDVAAWLAGVAGGRPPTRPARVIRVGADGAAAPGEAAVVQLDAPVAGRDPALGPAMSVGEVALAVDAGRDIAARAAADGVAVLVGTAPAADHAPATAALTAHLTGVAPPDGGPGARALALHGAEITGPLGALRRLGTGPIAVLCGVALGAGERGLGFAAHGIAAAAAAALAAGVEPAVRARLIAGEVPGDPVHRALLAHLRVPVVREGTAAGAAALAAALDRLAAELPGGA